MFDEIGVFYRGLVLGLMIAAPVGPIGLLCIRRTIHKGFPIGLATGFGAAVADTIFGAIAAFSVAAILEFLKQYDDPIRLLGGGFLLLVAWHAWHDPPRQPKESVGGTGAITALISGLVITLTNPVTLFATLAVVAAFSGLQTSREALVIVSGIFCGSALWWLILNGGVAFVRTYFTENRILLINRFTGIALAILALWAIAGGMAGLLGYQIPYIK